MLEVQRPAPTPTSSSWPAPTPSPPKASTPPSTAPPPASKPAPTCSSPKPSPTLDQYRAFAKLNVPILANITEFGSTPLFTLDELRSANVSLALYPLSAFRAANAAALNVYQHLRTDGTQQAVLNTMQTRADLYDYLNYHAYEQKLDQLFAKEKK